MPTVPAAVAPGQQTFQQAYLLIERTQRIECWFNPTTLDIHRQAGWVQKTAVGEPAAKSSYKGGEADSLTLNLLLHADGTRTGADVSKDLKQLWALPLPSVTPKGRDQARPPLVEFHWGTFISFTAVCKDVRATIELFDYDGTPLRVKVTLDLSQYEPEPGSTGALTIGQNPTSRATQRRRVHRIRSGETLVHIAFEHFGDGTKWRLLATDNQIEDPLRLVPGEELFVRLEEA